MINTHASDREAFLRWEGPCGLLGGRGGGVGRLCAVAGAFGGAGGFGGVGDGGGGAWCAASAGLSAVDDGVVVFLQALWVGDVAGVAEPGLGRGDGVGGDGGVGGGGDGVAGRAVGAGSLGRGRGARGGRVDGGLGVGGGRGGGVGLRLLPGDVVAGSDCGGLCAGRALPGADDVADLQVAVPPAHVDAGVAGAGLWIGADELSGAVAGGVADWAGGLRAAVAAGGFVRRGGGAVGVDGLPAGVGRGEGGRWRGGGGPCGGSGGVVGGVPALSADASLRGGGDGGAGGGAWLGFGRGADVGA